MKIAIMAGEMLLELMGALLFLIAACLIALPAGLTYIVFYKFIDNDVRPHKRM